MQWEGRKLCPDGVSLLSEETDRMQQTASVVSRNIKTAVKMGDSAAAASAKPTTHTHTHTQRPGSAVLLFLDSVLGVPLFSASPLPLGGRFPVAH